MRLLRTYPPERLDAACRRALKFRTLSYRSIKSILATGLDQADDEQPDLALPEGHAHVRGPDYYANHLSDKEN